MFQFIMYTVAYLLYSQSTSIHTMKQKSHRRRKKEITYDPFDYEIQDEENDVDIEPAQSLVEECFINSFLNEYQPEENEAEEFTIALTIGQLREQLHIYRPFDSKMPDLFSAYIVALEEHGFRLRVGFSGEQVMLVSHRNNGKALRIC